MDHPPTHNEGLAGLFCSIFGTSLAWISLQNAQTLMAIAASLFACGSAVLAGRYYWYAAKEKKEALKRAKP